MVATMEWVRRAMAGDQSPPSWGSRSDLLSRLVLIVWAVAVAPIGLEGSRTPFGRTRTGFWHNTYYFIAMGFLVAALVLKPTGVRARPSTKPA